MRSLLFSLGFLLVFPVSAQGQLDYTELAERLASYARAAMHQDVAALLDLTDPGLFAVIPRELLEEQFSVLTSSDRLEIGVTDFTVEEIGEVIDHDGVEYAPVRCRHRLSCRLSPEEFADPHLRNRLVRMLQKSYGAANVNVMRKRGLVVAEVEKHLFAVRRGGTDWHFFEYRDDSAGLLALVLPEAVRERFEE